MLCRDRSDLDICRFRSRRGSTQLPAILIWPLAMFVIGLTADLLHYIVAAFSWGVLHRVKERQGVGEDEEFGAPVWINYFPVALFWGKVGASLGGYCLLLIAILL